MIAGPTIELKVADRRRWDAAVVGAGPAGSLAARELTKLGLSVLLIDAAAFPRSKVCGCYLNGNALNTLDAVGLGRLAPGCNAVPIKCLQFGVRGLLARIRLRGGTLLSREALDTALITAAIDAGADFLPETRASLDTADGSVHRLSLRRGAESTQVSARVVLAADGLGGRLLARSGVKNPPARCSRVGIGLLLHNELRFYEPGTIYMACGRHGYLGIEQLEDGRLDMAGAFDASAIRAVGPGGAATRLLEEVGWPRPDDLSHRGWRGTPLLTRRAERLGMERAFAIGDAAGYVEPFTGEGMAWALASAIAVAPLASAAVRQWDSSLVDRWTELHRRLVGRRQLTCRAAAAILRRPRLTRLAMGLLRFSPALANPIIAMLNAPAVDEVNTSATCVGSML
jgi:flavin-dependent dehydrogenase